MVYSLRWNLDALFPGGSSSPQLKATVEEVEKDARDLYASWRKEDPKGPFDLAEKIQMLTELNLRFGDAFAFVGCLLAADVEDRQAALWQGKLQELGATLTQLERLVDGWLASLSEEDFSQLQHDPRLQPSAFNLLERRERAQRQMDLPLELLAAELSPAGYHGWNRLHSLVAGRLRIRYEADGKVQEVSAGQAESLLDHPRREIREAVFKGWEEAWEKETDVLALALNNLAGFRRAIQRRRGYRDPLDEPLEINRLQRKTLEAMWEAVDGARPRLRAYLQAKARFLGLEKLSWFDLSAPLFPDAPSLSYDEAAEIILREFSRLDPELYAMAKRAFEEGWIEAEDRPGKAQGGFCTRFNGARQSRIFLTFGGTLPDAATIAHELGHAYHNEQLFEVPPLSRRVPMALAETASTFAEVRVAKASLEAARDPKERLLLLDRRLQQSVTYLMNIRARFLFEVAFYQRREKGPVGVDDLKEGMLAAQKEAYADSLALYHPTFWASKAHFYITGVPFYNFPYTFGYLLTAALLRRAEEEGPSFLPRYREFLRESGRMTVEDLVERALGEDIGKVAFWEKAVEEALSPLDAFLVEVEKHA